MIMCRKIKKEAYQTQWVSKHKVPTTYITSNNKVVMKTAYGHRIESRSTTSDPFGVTSTFYLAFGSVYHVC